MFSPPDYSSPESFLGPRLGPFSAFLFMHRKALLDAVREAAPVLRGRLLDVGCGRKPYRSLLSCETYLGVDMAASPHAGAPFDCLYDGQNLPFGSAVFDSALCTEVLEHTKEPRRVLGEIARVLKPGGHVLVTAPMVLHHHEQPHDYFRFTRFGMKELAAGAGLSEVFLRARGGEFASAMAGAYVAVSSALSRRPLIDVILWSLWPMSAAAWVADGIREKRGRVPEMSLGWQMLCRKPDR
jgi:SAM-dependent methyltransferase